MMQGRVGYLGIIMCGTNACIEDTRRGVFSYEALRSRLEKGRFADDQTTNMRAPIITLSPLTQEELLILVERLDEIHAGLYGKEPSLSTNDDVDFLKVEFSRVGAGINITPREIIRDYIELLDIVMQNPNLSAAELIQNKLPQNQPTEQEEESDFADFIF
jgi:hypothetical protein